MRLAILTLCMVFSVTLYAAEYRTLEDAVKAAELLVGEKYNTPIAKEIATDKIIQIVNDAALSDDQKIEKLKVFIRLAAEQETFSSAPDSQVLEKDPEKSVEWYREAAEQGNADAQCFLGWCYDNGRYGVARDPLKAAEWFRKAAQQNNARAQFFLGLCYDKGAGVVRDPANAVEWYRKAADQGLAAAQYNLGICYDKGEGMTQDPIEAVKWYRKAAQQGLPLAQYSLGSRYEYGIGVAKDTARAVKWYRRAAEQGLAVAQQALERLE